MLTKSLLGLSLAACIASPTWADTTRWGRWSTIRFPARVGEMLSTGFYARTPSGSDVYIRQDQRVFRDGQLVNPVFLRTGDNVQVVVPAGKGQIRFRDDGVAVLSTPQGLAQVPEENLRLAPTPAPTSTHPRRLTRMTITTAPISPMLTITTTRRAASAGKMPQSRC